VCPCGGVGRKRFGEFEDEHLQAAVGRDSQVGGLQVAMDDAAVVCIFQGIDQLPDDWERFVGRERSARFGALEEFHDDCALFDAVDPAMLG
jgi:hypothetical protein